MTNTWDTSGGFLDAFESPNIDGKMIPANLLLPPTPSNRTFLVTGAQKAPVKHPQKKPVGDSRCKMED